MTRALVLDALRMALEVRAWLITHAMRQSMSGIGNYYDNAPMESLWHSMKVEETHGQDFAARAEATHSYVWLHRGLYNTIRVHSSLGYQSPAHFERARIPSLRDPLRMNQRRSTVIPANPLV